VGGISSSPFVSEYPVGSDGIVRALAARPEATLAHRSNHWRATAALYELWRKRSLALLTFGAYSTAQELNTLISWLELPSGARVLDAGCATGLYARTLLRHEPSLEIYALDASLAMLRRARTLSARDGVMPVLVQGDLYALPYHDASFDAVACGGTPNELTRLPCALGEFARVLTRRGKLWLMYLQRPRPLLERLLEPSGLRFYLPEEVDKLACTANLRPLRAVAWGVVVMALYTRR
jgi:ubiquinone/menaquinone biosynthesis C-methylase UbiE